MRRVFFGEDGSTEWNRRRLQGRLGKRYTHSEDDVRDRGSMLDLFARYGHEIALVVHTAAQPSHDWAAREPFVDFDINAVGTLNLLEATRLHAPEATFIFTSTNKVYGDRPNELPLVEQETRWEIEPRPHVLERDPRGHVDRQLPAQPLRRLEGRCGRARAGVRALLRPADGVLPRRDAHRPQSLRRRAARVPRLRHALRDDRPRLQRLRLQGQAGPGRDPQRRPDPRVRRVLPGAARGRGLQHRRRAVQQRFRPRGDRALPGDRRRGARVDVQGDKPDRRPHLVDRRQRVASRATTPVGSSSTTCRGSCRRSTTRTWTAGSQGRAGGRLAREASAVWPAAMSHVCRSRRRARESGRSPRARRRERAPAPRTASRSRRARRPRRNPL